ncbi:MAG: molybdate ABC transporter permease subunit [Gammaproteobacteria bacterium]|nr:molybdate ABC transporter permease subunit [Gammaproteobacteria bacterium]NND61003.1 molybdate ABC transporter permease subunit [Gammaproteobacteria bacterium]
MWPDLSALLLTAQLALVTTAILMVLGTPLAWWLAQSRGAWRPVVETLVAMPLVLPPTVLGFYLLLLLGPAGVPGRLWLEVTGTSLTFSFTGLVIASCVYSLPFVVQPLQNAFRSVPKPVLEAAHSLGASPRDAFFSVISPMAVRGYLTAAVMGFAHTLGEFGVVLMVGGNIPGKTRVVSIAIYDHVETLQYSEAHVLSLILLLFAFVALFTLYWVNRVHYDD